jgi:TRAP-type C4-dicarboxylate transport system permease small subunit
MIEKVDNFLDKFSYYSIVICVFLMLGLTVLNIALRWFNISILWIDPFVRHLVFMSAFLGGVLATGKDNHIRIDLIGKVLEKYNKKNLSLWITRFNFTIAILATFLLAKAGLDFTKVELEFGKEAFLGIHSGVLTAIIPFGMSLIGLRFLLRLLLTTSLNQEKRDQ